MITSFIMRDIDPSAKPCYAYAMNVTVRIPDELAERLAVGGTDLERRALEAFALAAYKARDLTHFELRELLGFETRFEFDDFLKACGIDEPVTPEDVRRDLADLKAFGA
jgi:hypothetical protein